jgi:hypothetical protein
MAARAPASLSSPLLGLTYLAANVLHRRELAQRDGHALGDVSHVAPLLEA